MRKLNEERDRLDWHENQLRRTVWEAAKEDGYLWLAYGGLTVWLVLWVGQALMGTQ